MSYPVIQTELPLLDELLEDWRDEIGADYDAYRNHVRRMLNFCFAFHQCEGDDQQKLIVAGCFHDLGIWTHHTFDYLEPSMGLAQDWLAKSGRADWSEEIRLMIDLHHRVRAVEAGTPVLVEVFRKGDWVDASLGWRRFGLPKTFVREVQRVFPNLGFHRGVVRQALRRMKKHPFSPFPMMKW